MMFQLFILPLSVSFSEIAVEEIPSNQGIHTGYFSNPYFAGSWYHTVERGAGRWWDVGYYNVWATDTADWVNALPRCFPDGTVTFNPDEGAWSDGTIVWFINCGWAEKGRRPGDPHVREFAEPNDQMFHIDERGTFTISKFQHLVARGTNTLVHLDGVLAQ